MAVKASNIITLIRVNDGDSGIIVSALAPSNPSIGQLWQTVSGAPIKRWNGNSWVLHYISVDNLNVQTLSAITAELGNVKSADITNAVDGEKAMQFVDNQVKFYDYDFTKQECGALTTEHIGNKSTPRDIIFRIKNGFAIMDYQLKELFRVMPGGELYIMGNPFEDYLIKQIEVTRNTAPSWNITDLNCFLVSNMAVSSMRIVANNTIPAWTTIASLALPSNFRNSFHGKGAYCSNNSKEIVTNEAITANTVFYCQLIGFIGGEVG